MTKPTLVTGANGHLGNNLCRQLAQRGERVRAMIRASADPAPLAGLDVEVVRGAILNAADVAKAVQGCGRVYHVAAGFLMWSRDPERDIIRPSVDGTRNVLEAAAQAGVEKLVYTSSSATIGFGLTPSTLRDETHFNTEPHTYYVRGKIAAEKEAFAIAERTRLPVVRAIAAVMALVSKLTGTRPMLDRSQVDEFAGTYSYFTSEKAEREFGSTYRSARETLQRTIDWLLEQGFVTEKRRQAITRRRNA